MKRATVLLASLLFPLLGCQSVPPIPPDPHERAGTEAPATIVGDEIVICGRRVDTGAPVVLWFYPGGYDAYDTAIRPGSNPEFADVSGRRYGPGRRGRDGAREPLVEPGTREVEELARVVDQFVLHYDVCGTSRTCFEVLQHHRGLSVHFLLDVDGTIYQTLDLRDTGWHATRANPRSVGIEIAQIGAYPPGDAGTLDEWYATDASGLRLVLPERFGDGGVRTPGFVGRPARPGRLSGTINGIPLVQYDFTPEQYDSLARLAAALCRELPRIRPDAPREASGEVRPDVLTDAEFEAFSGILGHNHVQRNKIDPGPAFDWERFLRDVRANLRTARAAP